MFLFCVTTLLGACQCHSLDVVSLAETGMGFNMAFRKTYINPTGFSAKLNVDILNPDGSRRHYPSSICQKGPLLRSDYHFAEWEILEANLRKGFKTLGCDEVATIFNLETNRITCLFPRLTAFIEMPAPDDFLDTVKQLTRQRVPRLFQAHEVLNGHRCEKFRISKLSDPELAFAWQRPDLDYFPVKIQITRKSDVTTIEVVDFRLLQPDPKQFEVPPGYVKYADADAVMKEGIRRARERGDIFQPNGK
jgi:hypothetical protein